MNISEDIQKALDKIQHPFMITKTQQIRKEGNFLNLIKATTKTTANKMLNTEGQLKAFPPRSRTEKGVCSNLLYWRV